MITFLPSRSNNADPQIKGVNKSQCCQLSFKLTEETKLAQTVTNIERIASINEVTVSEKEKETKETWPVRTLGNVTHLSFHLRSNDDAGTYKHIVFPMVNPSRRVVIADSGTFWACNEGGT